MKGKIKQLKLDKLSYTDLYDNQYFDFTKAGYYKNLKKWEKICYF